MNSINQASQELRLTASEDATGLHRKIGWAGAFWVASGVPALVLFSIGSASTWPQSGPFILPFLGKMIPKITGLFRKVKNGMMFLERTHSGSRIRRRVHHVPHLDPDP